MISLGERRDFQNSQGHAPNVNVLLSRNMHQDALTEINTVKLLISSENGMSPVVLQILITEYVKICFREYCRWSESKSVLHDEGQPAGSVPQINRIIEGRVSKLWRNCATFLRLLNAEQPVVTGNVQDILLHKFHLR